MRRAQIALAVTLVVGVVVGTHCVQPRRETVVQQAVIAPVPIPPPAPAPEVLPPPPPEPLPTLVEAGQQRIERRVNALAAELGKMWTRHPEQLVAVIDDASRSDPKSPSVTLLLAIAHAETNGKILDVSEAGAVGLAQATPVAYLQEGFDGKIFITNDYLIGARAYITKKPLGDADRIATMLMEKNDKKTRAKAKRLLTSAFELRREGLDELDILEPHAPAAFYSAIDRADRRNLAALRELKKLLDKGSDKKTMRAYRDRVRREYRALRTTQQVAWRSYQKELAAERDALLEQHFGVDADVVKKTQPYEAGQFLGEQLDERFSARRMATFLVRHLETKAAEARTLGADDARVEEMTAALYNGGSHNVKRMLSGLIASLPETEKYMKKVPATRRRLDEAVCELEPVDAVKAPALAAK